MHLWDLTRGSHFTILQGECHLMELDCPERVVDEAFAFIDQAHKKLRVMQTPESRAKVSPNKKSLKFPKSSAISIAVWQKIHLIYDFLVLPFSLMM